MSNETSTTKQEYAQMLGVDPEVIGDDHVAMLNDINARDIDKVAILLAGMVIARRQSERDKGRKGK